MSEFRYRSLNVLVDTTQPAEFQIQGYQLSDRFMDRVAKSFKAAPLSLSDMEYGALRLRSIDGYDFVFVLGRDVDGLVVTIGDVWPTEKRPKFEELLKKGEFIAMLRGASGM